LDDPDAKGKVLYVWFDAPIGYISNTMQLCAEREGDPNRADEWWRSDDTEIYHFIGEDNTVFHCIIWIAMLSAEGTIRLPKGVIVNQYVNMQAPGQDVEKISKSRGTAIWIEDLLGSGIEADSVRYYLTAIAPETARSVYRPDDFRARHNGELADTLGNLVNRITSFTIKHCGTQVPEYDKAKVTERDEQLMGALRTAHQEATSLLEGFSFRAAQERVMEFARECNRYVDDKAPWTSRKTDMEATKVTLAYSLKAIHALGVMLAPFIPDACEKIVAAFGDSLSSVAWSDAVDAELVGRPLSQPPILFQKLEKPEQ
jgi:methionyl-tRNA synthetase